MRDGVDLSHYAHVIEIEGDIQQGASLGMLGLFR